MVWFYKPNEDYIRFLQKYEPKIPNINYKNSINNKFVCGVVLKVNDIDYYAPVSHFNIKQRTNFPIYDKDKIISSVRLCFMFPAFFDVLNAIDIKELQKEHYNYAKLVEKEYFYIKNNIDRLENAATKVYRIGCNDNHKLNYTCCNFKNLEKIYNTYANQEVASTKEPTD